MQYLATYLVFVAVIARAIGWNQDTFPIPSIIWILLAVFGIVLSTEQLLTRQFPLYPRLYLVIQTGLVISLFYVAPKIDFLALLFLPLSFQAVQFFPNWIGFSWIGLCILAMAGRLLLGLEWQSGLTSVLTGAGTGFLMGSCAYLISRTEQRQQENHRMFGRLQEAYSQLKDSVAQAEALAAMTERHRLVRELHDSLTQTLFSMNLAVQAAQLAIEATPEEADQYLIRLQTLARNAVSEVQALTGQAPYPLLAHGELAKALQKLAQERLDQDGLRVKVEVTGTRTLAEPVESGLYRIAQEALNNISRHSGVQDALVRLHLQEPGACLEVIDAGCGFDLAGKTSHGRYGLEGMAERAREIGWKLEINSKPGQGTHVRVTEALA